MLTNYFVRRAERRREQRSRLVDALIQQLDREHSLVVNSNLIARMGVTRRVFFHVVYSLVMQERMHMMADSEGDVVLMTNEQYHRFMLRRSGVRETEIRLRQDVPVAPETVAEHAIPAIDEDTVVIDPVAAELATLASDLAWFNLDVTPTGAAREKVPPKRQSLPERQREPWLAEEKVGSDFSWE